MQIVNDNPVVVINIPRFCVPAEQADEFIQAANRFWASTLNTIINNGEANRLEYNNHYANGEFIPTVIKKNTYTDILTSNVEVEQLDKYIEISQDEKYVNSADIYKMWHPEVEDGEES